MFLRTERLFLRPAWLEDAPELARAIGHEPIVRMLTRAPWPYREEHARAWIAGPQDWRLPGLLVTLPNERGRIVGGCGLQAAEDHVEVGYWTAPEYWGRGYATEALKGLLSLARLVGHERLVARHALENPASGQVLHKAGFRPTGRTRSFHSLGRGTGTEGIELALELGEMAAPQCSLLHRPARSPCEQVSRVAA